MAEKDYHAFRETHVSLLPLAIGLVFFAASLTPSLIPREWFVQGVLGGLLMAIGYMAGRFALTLWRLAELPLPRGRIATAGDLLALLPAIAIAVWNLFRAADWQNSVRVRVAMDPIDGVHALRVLLLAMLVFLLCFVLGRLVQRFYDLLRNRLDIVMRRRTANILGLVAVGAIIFIGTREGILPAAMDAADDFYETGQDLFDPESSPPADPRMAGSVASLIDWGAMGRPGRDFIRGGPDQTMISAFTGRPAKKPIRVYVGRAQADTPEERAEIALAELKRLGAFERKILVVASPTGTGWLDPGAHGTVEYMHDGDVATVAVQYSYLQSPLALIFETASGLDQATATMHAIYSYWTSLPPDRRPAFYLGGISLGAWSSMYSFDIFQMVNDPIDGALWAGPPFPSDLWRRAVAARNPGSPYILPQVGEGELFRFASQFADPHDHGAPWGRVRIVFLQYASDPIVFFDPGAIWRRPVWMREPPAPDVSPDLSFMPVVTQFQLALDMALSKDLPQGYGHNYVARDYIDAWVEVSRPEGWTAGDTERLKTWCGPQSDHGCHNEKTGLSIGK
jgi:uncharacterized membrane protein